MSDAFDTSAGLARALGGAQRVAALLLAMERATAQALLKRFTPAEIRAVTVAAAKLGDVPHDALDELVERFQRQFVDASGLHGDETHARELVGSAVTPDLVSSYLEGGAEEGPEDVWKAVSALPEKALIGFLAEEHELIVTCILSRLDAQLTSRLVAALPRELRNATLIKLMAPPPINAAALQILEQSLRHALLGGGTTGASADEARARIAEIINGLEPTDAEDVMQALEAARPADARAVRSLLFSFLDLPRLSQRARALLFDKLSTDLVVMALRNTEAEFREAALSAMAARSRRLVEGELGAAATVKPADIAKARREVVALVLTMAQKGELDLPSNEAGDGLAAA